jgi:hypothetical protein
MSQIRRWATQLSVRSAGACLILSVLLVALAGCGGTPAGTRIEVATAASRGATNAGATAPETLPGQGGTATAAAPRGASATVAPDAEGAATGVPSGSATGLPLGWRTYTDPAAGYSIGLPPGVDFRAGWNAAGVYTARAQFKVPGVTGYQGLVVRVEPNPQGHGLEQILEGFYRLSTAEQPPADLLAQAQSLTVAGLAAVKTAGQGDDFAIVVPYGDKICYLAPVHDMATTGLDPHAMALFNEILGTFRVVR